MIIWNYLTLKPNYIKIDYLCIVVKFLSMKQIILPLIVVAIVICGCNNPQNLNKMNVIDSQIVDATIEQIAVAYPDYDKVLIKRGVTQVANFWMNSDGSQDEFKQFCIDNFKGDKNSKQQLFETIQTNLEVLYGNFNKISVDLKLPLHVADGKEITQIDEIFGAWDPYAHLADDMYADKVAFIIMLNFPFYNLDEKNTLGKTWSRQEWAYARMGDVFSSRVPAELSQKLAKASSDADNYISNYNIVMGNLRNENSEKLFPDGMNLISHWGLRDELKSNYANKDNGLEKQKMIYEIMKHIIYQTIPQQVINNDEYVWYPQSNKVLKDGKPVDVVAEPNTRYEQLYNIYLAQKAIDDFCPTYPTYVQRSFDQQMEVSYNQIEQMFTDFVSSPEVAKVGKMISERLGRDLEPFDIWYDGFKSRSNISEDYLSEQTRALYPDVAAVQNGLPSVLCKLGFADDRAVEICSMIKVDPSRGAGHAWGAQMRGDKARLRTRIAEDGMDYKGYNIAVHEFGHNVEQTITLNDVDNYMMNGVPNTAFTEALAFVFQTRDLELLGIKDDNPDKQAMQTLDIFWGCYEIMGVALVDMKTWKWLYENPDAGVAELKETIIKNAKEIWNMYYAPVLGSENSPILAVYSHMIDIPLYLPNYPFGHIVQFQLEKQIEGKNIADEIQRIFPAGRLTPNIWMNNAVGSDVSVEPLLEAVRKIVD